MIRRSALLLPVLFLLIIIAVVMTPTPSRAQLSGGGSYIDGNTLSAPSKPTKKPTPTPIDAQRVWNNTGSDFNTTTDWTGGIVPTTGDVAAFSASASNLAVNLSTSVTISGLYFKGTAASGYDITASAGASFTLQGTASDTSGTEASNTGAAAIGADNTSGTNTIDANVALGGSGAQTFYQAAGGTLIINGIVSGTSRLTINGAGTIQLNGTNTISGGVTLSNGTLNLGSAGAIGSSGTIVFNGGILQFSANNTTDYSGRFSTVANQTMKIDTNGQSVTFASQFSPTSGSGSVTKLGSGTLTLSSGSSKYANGTTVSAGTLAVGASTTISGGVITQGPIGTGTLTLSDGTTLQSNSSTARTLPNNLSLSGSVTLGATSVGTGTLNFDPTGLTTPSTTTLTGDTTLNTNVNVTIAEAISGAFNLTKAGASILTMSGSAANTYSGTTTINAGELDLSKTAGTNAIAGNVTIGDGTGTDILKLVNSDQIANTSDMTINSSGVFDLTNLSETIDALNGSSGATILLGSTGILTVGANNETAANYAGNIQGSGNFVKTGTGTQTLSGTSIFSGFLDILNGDLRFNSGTADNATIRLGDTSGSNVAVLSLGATTSGNTISSALTVRSGSSGTKLLRSLATSGTNTYAGAITLNDNLTIESASNGAISSGTFLFQSGSIDVTNKTLTIDTQIYNTPSLNGSNGANGQGAVTINEVLGSSLASGGALVKDGSNTLILQGTSNNYTGTNAATLNANGTTIKDGVLGIYGDGSLGLAPSSAQNNIFFASSSLSSATQTPTLQDTSNNVTLSSTRNINVASGVTARFDSNGNTFTINGVINGSGNIDKISSGSLVLNGNNTYTGTTTVDAGTLYVNGNQSSATGTVTVNSGGTLAGNGTIGGAVDVKSGGTLSPGASIGTLHTGALTLEAGSTFAVDLSATLGNDLIVAPSVTLGALITGPSLSLNISGTLTVGQQFFIVDNTGLAPVTGVFSQGATITSGTYVFLVDYVADFDTLSAAGGNDIMLQVTAVPEPSTYVAAALAAAVIGYSLVVNRRRKRQQAAA